MKYKINPLEVKSSKNYTTTSLGRSKEVFGKKIETQIIHPKNFSVENDVIKIPPYIAYNSLAKIETGARTPSLDLLADMVAYFNVKLDFLGMVK